MEIQLSIAVTESFGINKSVIFSELSNRINQFIKGKVYGEDIKKIKIGFIMALNHPGYEDWYQPKKATYTDYKISKSRLTGEQIEITKQLSLEIKLEENLIGSFINANNIEAQKLIIREILSYLQKIKKFPNKIKDFNEKRLVTDLEEFQATLVE